MAAKMALISEKMHKRLAEEQERHRLRTIAIKRGWIKRSALAEAFGIAKVGVPYDLSTVCSRDACWRRRAMSEDLIDLMDDLHKIHNLSGFFLRSNKPITVPCTRWSIGEAIPIALKKAKPKGFTTEDLKLMALTAKQESLFARQMLTNKGFIEADPKNRQFDFDDPGGKDA